MKIKYFTIIFALLCAVSVDSIAHEEDKPHTLKSKSGKDKNEKIASNSSVDSISLKNHIDITNSKLVDSLVHNYTEANRQIDSLTRVIEYKNQEIAKLRADIGFVDTCMVKLANRWLYEPFNKEDVDEAIKYFDRIYSTKLRDGLSIVQLLLKDYESAYKEFQEIIKEAQMDRDRKNPFVCNEYKSKYIRKIESMSYYIKYYKNNWNIRYLNDQIKSALDRFKNHTDKKPADLSSLLDSNFYF